ncbi:hypothetical protein ScPMuIL_015985 [Solemya velum]
MVIQCHRSWSSISIYTLLSIQSDSPRVRMKVRRRCRASSSIWRHAVYPQSDHRVPAILCVTVCTQSHVPSLVQELFSDTWLKDLEVRLEKFLTLALKSTPQPKLFELYQGVRENRNDEYQQINQLQQQLVECERRPCPILKDTTKYRSVQRPLLH